jgi:hypothetical protein
MIPRVTSKGKSFKGAGAYFLHDLGKAKTSERVAFTHTVNMLTNDPEKALKVMAWTAEHATELKQVAGQKLTGRKAENPVYNYVLAWAPDQNPDQAHMTEFGLRSLKALGLQDHEAIFIAHNDTDHLHLHVIANRVHPETGIMAKMSKDQIALSRLAQAYEEETGQVYCAARVANNEERSRGALVKAEKIERLSNTPDYQERRAARIEAQRDAAALAAQKLADQAIKDRAARDLRADFDQVSAQDDRQYRAREIEPSARDEATSAPAAWADERAKDAAERQARKETVRRQALDEKRAAAWADFEAQQWQRLNDKQTERREGLYDLQATVRAKVEGRIARKYGPDEALTLRQLEEARDRLSTTGVRGALDQLTGARDKHAAEVRALEAAQANLERQKEAERKRHGERQAAQRAAQADRHKAEQQRLAQRLQETKAAQDAAFEAREKTRADRLAETHAARDRAAAAAREQAAEAQRQAVRDQVARTQEARAQRAQERDQQQEWGLGR